MGWRNVVRKHEGWLATYHALAKFIGWLLIFFGLFNLSGSGYMMLTGKTPQGDSVMAMFVMPFTEGIVPGLLALVVAGFLRYLLKPEEKVNFWLGIGDRVLYLAAAVYLVKTLWVLDSLPRLYIRLGLLDLLTYIALAGAPTILLQLAKILIAVGLAQALRRLLAIIHESKTLI